MDVPLQIAFHKVEQTAWAEGEIRARVAKLQKIYDRIIGCRVTIDQRAEGSNGSVPPVVRIEISLPGTAPLMVTHEPERLQRKFQRPEMDNAIHEAFSLAERRLIELKGRRGARTKAPHHDGQNQFLGQVVEMHPDNDHGFIMTKEGGLLYFHRNAVLVGDFDALKRGDDVHYVEEMGDTGPLATKVRAVAAR